MAAGIVEKARSQQVDVEFHSPGTPPSKPNQVRAARLTMNDRDFLLQQDSKIPPLEIPFEDARRIQYRNHSEGALYGFLIGSIPGVVMGFALGAYANAMACSGSDQEDVDACHNHSDPTWKAVLGLGLVTGGIGALIGALVGHRTVYTF